jgi:acyl dehydratase
MSIEYYEDIKLHQKYRSEGYHLKKKEIIDYAKKWDPQPQHIDPEQAKNTVFGGLVACGAHVIAIYTKLQGEINPKWAFVAGLGADKTRFLAPARPGDILTLENEAIWKRESKSRSNAGVVHFDIKLINQLGEIVYTSEGTGLVEKRPVKSAL